MKRITTSWKSSSKIALMKLRYYYLFDKRPFCVAYSGGKDSTVIVDLVLKMLLELRDKYNTPLNKEVYIVNSNTLAELPPVLDYVQKSLDKITEFVKKQNLPIEVKEVKPDFKNTLNVQLFGVGMPPPTNSFRWCTTKLKVMPIESYIKEIFPDGRFISIIGSRKAESHDRASRLSNASRKGTNLKFNSRYVNASNLAPIEDWSVKDVWTYLFDMKQNYIDTSFLWKLYSDASGKDTNECSFVGAGGKHIDEGKIGCGVSRFGCWQCYITRDKDKSLDGLYKSGYENVEYFKEFRDWFWSETQKGWEVTRDVYSHNHHYRDYYNKGNEKDGMTMPKGLTLDFRKRAFIKFMELESTVNNQQLITNEEILLIQDRWLKEGDLNLSALKIAEKYNRKQDKESKKKFINEAKKIKDIFKQTKKTGFFNNHTKDTIKRFAAQSYFFPKKVEKQFYPTVEEESHIRKEWKAGKPIKLTKKVSNKTKTNIISSIICSNFYETIPANQTYNNLIFNDKSMKVLLNNKDEP